MAEAPERPNLRQCLKDALVRKAQVNSLAELLQRGRLLPRFTRRNDRLGGSGADILDP
jgi:hypothetical protein